MLNNYVSFWQVCLHASNEAFKKLGALQKTTRTHANNVQGLIRTTHNAVADRANFTKRNWTDLNKPTLKKYNGTMHSSTGP